MDRFRNDEFLVGLYLYSNLDTKYSRHKPVHIFSEIYGPVCGVHI
jgi:hypothetical protein